MKKKNAKFTGYSDTKYVLVRLINKIERKSLND